jgi:MFS family permease
VRHPFWRVTLPLSGVNFLTQAARAVLSVVGPVLAVEYGLSASELGLLSAVMFGAYCLWQLPVGLLLDLYGPRAVQSAMGVVAAAGFASFAMADGMGGFMLARALTGIGVASGLMAVLKSNSQWYARHQVAAMTGIAMVVAGTGGLAVTAPAQAILPLIGWRGVFWALAVMSLAMSAWCWVSAREPWAPQGGHRRTLGEEVAVIGAIYSNRRFWRWAPAVILLTVINFSYQGLWAGPWLRDVAGQGATARAETLFCFALGLMGGAFVNGQLASRLQARGFSPMTMPLVSAVGLAAVQVGLLLEPSNRVVVTVLWVLFPGFASAGPAGYAAIAQIFPVEQMGRVSTAINTATLAGAFGLQTLIGWILDLWPRTASGGWNSAGYGWALGVSLVLQAVALLWAWWPGRGLGRAPGRDILQTG